ncbi:MULTISPECIES: helix-turn-helix domain-containing protein [Acinetobacter]|uniref:HTH cro/C1-type domain-containing protein n=1 Tax=Acinetobacter higginsii TaxID=70347 RepID=N9T455_9GAMM|nr:MULTISPECIES: helix-turn-helix transcriptional regulator [Acinetobacter]ENX58145.1 hypothetical protein F902_02545 [Acinetobacter higginsii]
MIDGFGAKLKKHRVAAGLTQGKLAELSGVSRKQISDFEMEIQKNPKAETLTKLANAFKISIEDLLSDEDAITGRITLPNKTDLYDSFGLRLKYFRSGLNITQEELSKLSGVSRKQISDFEMGLQNRPRLSTVHKLASALGISPFKLYPEKKNKTDDELLNQDRSAEVTLEFPAELVASLRTQAEKNGRSLEDFTYLLVMNLMNQEIEKINKEYEDNTPQELLERIQKIERELKKIMSAKETKDSKI